MARYLVRIMIGGLMAASASCADAQDFRGDFEIVAPEDLVWTPWPDALGASYAAVFGDPSKPGVYVVRVRFPAGVMDLPHSHSADRHVTVIEGTWYAGTGRDFDPAAAKPLAAGGYMYHPANGAHWDGAAGDEAVIVQIIGVGPVETRQEHDGEVDWVNVNPAAGKSVE